MIQKFIVHFGSTGLTGIPPTYLFLCFYRMLINNVQWSVSGTTGLDGCECDRGNTMTPVCCQHQERHKSLPGHAGHPSGPHSTIPQDLVAELPSVWPVVWTLVTAESVLSTGVRTLATLLHNEVFADSISGWKGCNSSIDHKTARFVIVEQVVAELQKRHMLATCQDSVGVWSCAHGIVQMQPSIRKSKDQHSGVSQNLPVLFIQYLLTQGLFRSRVCLAVT